MTFFYKYLFTFIISLSPCLVLSQINKNTYIRKEVKNLFAQNLTDTDDILSRGKSILKIAKSDGEYKLGYSMLADAMYKKQHYSEALRYFIKTDSLQARLSNEPVYINQFFMTDIYLKVGLLIKAKESLSLVKSKITPTEQSFVKDLIAQQQAVYLEEMYDFCGAVLYRKQNVKFAEQAYQQVIDSENRIALAFQYNLLIFDLLKCGASDEALHYAKKLNVLVDQFSLAQLDVSHLFYINQAIFDLENNRTNHAKINFYKALEIAENDKDNGGIRQVLEERINYNIDNKNEKTKNFIRLNQLKSRRRIEANKIITAEEKYKNDMIRDQRQQLFFTIAIAIVIILMVVLLFFWRKKRDFILQNQKAVTKLDGHAASDASSNENLDPVVFTSEKVSSEIQKFPSTIKMEESPVAQNLLSRKKEEELLNKLIEFEKGIDFTEKNFTISNMVSLFESNPKYINYILQKHRGKLFSDYVNAIRIQYLSDLLIHKPEYRNYKISYLSEMAGYSSHSRFAMIFKKETGVSPSEFIAKLTGEN